MVGGLSWRRCALAAFVVCVICGAVEAQTRTEADDRRLFDDFKLTYGRTYSGDEDIRHFLCFREVLQLIDQRNAETKTAQHGVNQFSDVCPNEFRKTHFGFINNFGEVRNNTKLPLGENPSFPTGKDKLGDCAAIDLRAHGLVTPVKNQGRCGSCWSFSSTGNMEGAWALAGHGLISLSEEELVACADAPGLHGCNGGIMVDAWVWVYDNGGIDSEQGYPYTSGNGAVPACDRAKLANKVATIEEYYNLEQNEDYMAEWVCERGVVSIGVDALSWQTYTGGILTNCPDGQMDHAVLIVGYDSVWSPPYWIIKNSWGAAWGENGYIRLIMGVNACGIANAPCATSAP